MLFYVNNRLLRSGETLKVLLLAPEMGRTSVQPGPGQNLIARFRLRDTADSVIDLEGTRTLEIRMPQTYPAHAAEFRLPNIKPAQYVVEALIGRELVGELAVTIIDDAVAKTFDASLTGEALRDFRKFETVESFRDAWEQSWRDLYAYLGVAIPTHFGTTYRGVTVVPPLMVHASRWALFHVNQVIFEMVFFGGEAQFLPVEGTPSQFRYVVRPRVSFNAESLTSKLNRLSTMLVDPSFSVSVTAGSPPAEVPPFTQQSPPPTAILMNWK